MKKMLKLFAMALMAGAMFTACGGDDNEAPGKEPDPDKPGTKYPPVTVTSKPGSSVKAGMAGAIEIQGGSFDETQDYIFIGYDNETGGTQYDRVTNDVLAMDESSISFGVRIDAPFIGKTVKVYLDRPNYDRMPLTDGFTFTLPTVAEGYIPDPAFRAQLQSPHNNPEIAKLFNSYGMLDVAAAGKIEHGGSLDHWALDLSGCAATSLEGIELLKNIGGASSAGTVVAAWGMNNIVEMDFSKWTAIGIDFRCGDAGIAKLEKFVAGPNMWAAQIQNCPNLKTVDLSPSTMMFWVNIWNSAAPGYTTVTDLDLRKDMSGVQGANNRPTVAGQYAIYDGNSYFKVADNAKIKIDSWFIFDHNVSDNGNPSCWANIYDAWKRGATIDVYSSVKIDQKLGTVPMYNEDPDALSPEVKKGSYDPANKWQIDDPNTPGNEAPHPYVK